MKIDIAFMFHLISKAAHDDLVIMKDIRNRFAHDLEVADFNDQSIAAKCANLKLVELHVVDRTTEPLPQDMEAILRLANEQSAEMRKRGVRFQYGGIGAVKELSEPRLRYIWSAKVFTGAFGANWDDTSMRYPLPPHI